MQKRMGDYGAPVIRQLIRANCGLDSMVAVRLVESRYGLYFKGRAREIPEEMDGKSEKKQNWR